jgi:hypothetical protein
MTQMVRKMSHEDTKHTKRTRVEYPQITQMTQSVEPRRRTGERSRSERPEEFLRQDSGLPQDTPQSANRNRAMHRNDTAD